MIGSAEPPSRLLPKTTFTSHLIDSSPASKASSTILETFRNLQGYEISVYRHSNGKVLCNSINGTLTKVNIAILATPEYVHQPIIPEKCVFYQHLNAFVLGSTPLTYEEKDLVDYRYVSALLPSLPPLIKSDSNPASRDLNSLIHAKMANSHFQLTAKESIDLLNECIKLGEAEAHKIGAKDLVVIIGGMNAGKSVFINYVYGCEIEEMPAQELGISALGKLMVVKKSRPRESAYDEVIPISHTGKPSTFFAQMATDEKGVHYCECPNFFYDSGFEINMARIVSTRQVVRRASSVKFVMLINFNGLMADKAKSLKDLIDFCVDFFGSKENFLTQRTSLLFGVTHIPPAGDEQAQTLDHLKRWFRSQASPFDEEIMNCLAERLFIYDPLNTKKPRYSGAWSRKKITQNIQSLIPLRNPSALFNTVLRAEDSQGLRQVRESYERRITSIIGQDVINDDDYKRLADCQKTLKRLEILQHPQIKQLLDQTRLPITQFFKQFVWDFNLLCAREDLESFKQAQALLKTINERLSPFDKETKEIVYQYFHEDAPLSQKKEGGPFAWMRGAALQNAKYNQTMHDLVMAANDEAEKIHDRLSQNLQNFSEECEELSASLHDLIRKLTIEVEAGILISADRLTQTSLLLDFTHNTLQTISSTSMQYINLEKKGTDIQWKGYKGALEIALHARQLEIDQVKQQLIHWHDQKNHEWAIFMKVHGAKWEEERQMFDQLLQIEDLKGQTQNAHFERGLALAKQGLTEIHERTKFSKEESEIYYHYQMKMHCIEIQGFKKMHRMDVEARYEMAKMLARHLENIKQK